jgi:hypothetical protein
MVKEAVNKSNPNPVIVSHGAINMAAICIICTYRERQELVDPNSVIGPFEQTSSRPLLLHRKRWHLLHVRQTVCASYWKVSVFFCWHRNIRSASLSLPAATGPLSFWWGSAERGILSSVRDKRISLHVSYWNFVTSTWLDVLRCSSAALPCPNRVIIWLWSNWCPRHALSRFPSFYGTRRFITVFTRARYWSLSWARSMQSIPSHPLSLRYILILSTYLGLGLPSGLFPPERDKSSRCPPIIFVQDSF